MVGNMIGNMIGNMNDTLPDDTACNNDMQDTIASRKLNHKNDADALPQRPTLQTEQ